MSVKFYKCPLCGNISMMLEDSGVVPTCCGQAMQKLEPETEDSKIEKHLPVVCCSMPNIVHVVVGSVLHPMTTEHHLQFIVLETSKGVQVQYLKPGDSPRATFKLCHESKPVAAYSYCNLHGLWAKTTDCEHMIEQHPACKDIVKEHEECEKKADEQTRCDTKPKNEPAACESRRGCGALLALLFCILAPLCACSSGADIDNTPVSSVNLNSYLGDWYEIARFDHRFERNLTHCRANYSINDNGTIKVTNTGMKKGKWKTSTGKAKITKSPGLLRVSFFGPFYSDYRILMLGPNYSYALVGSDSDDYLWILSRTPKLDISTRRHILAEATRRGYDTTQLIWVDQDL